MLKTAILRAFDRPGLPGMLVTATVLARAIGFVFHSLRTDSSRARRGPAARTVQFRVQFVCAAPECNLLMLKEVGLEAADVSGAIVATATLPFPPKTIGLRILDPDGRQVFARRKAGHWLRSFSGTGPPGRARVRAEMGRKGGVR
jgi:hypothetical protein